MADFSKQWCEINDPEMEPDFDILEIAELLKPDEYLNIICEGFGFVAIGRSNDYEIMLAMPVTPVEGDEEEYIQWTPYNEVIK